jgi:hypothetical protein
MTEETDQITVPTNGKSPHPVEAPLAPLRGEPPTAEPPRTFNPTDPALLGAVSPKQLAIGFGIVASLVLLAVARARRGRSGR